MSLPFRYLPESLHDADAVMRWCTNGPSWQHENIRLFGRLVRVPRMVAWYGDPGIRYGYSGLQHAAEGWPKPLSALREELTERLGMNWNFVLLNRYRDGRDWMGWHRDDEKEMRGPVASVSLGATRRFRLQDGDERYHLDLEHGSVVVFDGRLRHTLARTSKSVGERFNLTFRCIDELAQRADC